MKTFGSNYVQNDKWKVFNLKQARENIGKVVDNRSVERLLFGSNAHFVCCL